MLKSQGRVGAIEIARVHDMTLLSETAQSWFPDFNRDAVRPHEHWLCPLHYDRETGRIPMPVHSFVLEIKGKIVLIDTCVGSGKDRPMIGEMHRLHTDYLDRLAQVGLTTADVDYVMCTHLHVDHVGWNTQMVDGRWVPTFPNARYIMARDEFLAAEAEAAETPMAALRNCFADSVMPVVDAGQVDFVEGVHEILDLLTLRPAPGHSAGHMRIELRSEGKTAVFSGDMIHSPMQIPLWQWSSKVCWDPAMATHARRELLEFCISEGALLLPGHFDAPHVARIRAENGSFMPQFGW